MNGAEQVVRRLALAGVLPELAPALPAIPAGWTGLLEIAAHALEAQGLSRGLRFLRSDACSGVLVLWPDTDAETISPGAAQAIEAICEWAEVRSSEVCMADGTPGAGPVVLGGRRLALGSRARTLPIAELGRLIWPLARGGERHAPENPDL
ncbi:hypothetical protein [Roseicella frigidaeris]|uniref:hypothetical protein n=1 Tax=Roseicella frigidaeris TaxID=2230885 RepID=UPI001402791B|nr:hypothetical protein [Roseicella frigidaeris]